MKKSILPFLLILFITCFCDNVDNREHPNCIPETTGLFEPQNLSITNHRDNVLRKQLNFSTFDSSSCFVIYWKEDGRQIITKKTRPEIDHSLILINMEELTDYFYLIVQETSSGNYLKSQVFSFTTEEIPVAIDPYSFNPHAQIYDDSFQEYILVHQRDVERNLLVLLNGKGSVIWYEKFTKSPKVFDWTSRGTILCMLADKASLLEESDEILEINLFGDTLTHIFKSTETFDKGIHHDILLNRAGNIYTIHYDYRIINFSPLGIHETDTVFCDGITELDSKGNKIWEWSAFDVIDPLSDPVVYKRRSDWLHANGITEDSDNNIILSFRNNNQIWKIDRSTGAVLWKFGEDGDFELEEQAQFIGQHHVHFSSTGDLMMFDNNNEKSRSRILYFTLDETHMIARLSREILLPVRYYSYIMGSAYETTDHNLLVNTTSGGFIALVDNRGSVIWEIGTNTYPYRAVLVKNLNDNYAYCR